MHNDTHPSIHTRLQVVEDDLTGAAAALVRSEREFYDAAWRVNISGTCPAARSKQRRGTYTGRLPTN